MQRGWTTTELKTLRRLARDDSNVADIARALGRSTCSVRSRAARSGIDLPQTRETWTTKDIETLRAMAGRGASVANVAAALDRSYYAIKGRAEALRISFHAGRATVDKVPLPADLALQLKVAAHERGIPPMQLARTAIAAALRNATKPAKVKPEIVPPPPPPPPISPPNLLVVFAPQLLGRMT